MGFIHPHWLRAVKLYTGKQILALVVLEDSDFPGVIEVDFPCAFACRTLKASVFYFVLMGTAGKMLLLESWVFYIIPQKKKYEGDF